MERKIKKLVVDTGALVKRVPLWDYAEEFYCIHAVIREVRDRQTRRYIDALPLQLNFREPSASSIKFINDFTKKTGDFASLSLVDVKILALTYDLEKEAVGDTSHLRSEPEKQRTQQIISVRQPKNEGFNDIEGFYMPSNKREVKLRNSSTDISTISSPTPNQWREEGEDDEYEGGDEDEEEDEEELEEREEFILGEKHLEKLDDHLSLYPYIGGYIISEDDVCVVHQLQSHFSLMKELSELQLQHMIGGQLQLMLKICRDYGNEFERTIKDECASLKIARQFNLEYGHRTHFVRWFLHLLTFDETELKNATPSHLSLKEIFNSLSNHNDSENGNTEDTLNNADVAADLDALHISPEPEKELETQISDKNELIPCEDITSNITETENTISEEHMDESDEGNESGEEEEESDGSSESEGSYDESEEDDEEDDEDDDEGWITPSNIKTLKKHNRFLDEDISDNVQVACVTGDFSMQNTLKHIGLRVMGIDGKLIKSVRTFILRCYGCFKTTDKMEKLFCPHCGHKTLKRVSVTLNPDGTQKIWISSRKPINIRGMKFSLPRPKGGKFSINPILVADQKEAHQRTSKLSRMKNNPMHEDYTALSGVSPFVTRDVYSRSAQLGLTTGKKRHRGLFYWEQKNPNVPLKKGTSKKKR